MGASQAEGDEFLSTSLVGWVKDWGIFTVLLSHRLALSAFSALVNTLSIF